MGLMRLTITPPDRITEEMAQQSYLCGLDRVPWKGWVRWQPGELTIQRAVSESGNLHIPWQVEGHGLVTLSTATLRERPEPYRLPLELARGKIGQVRNQLAEWQMLGLTVPAIVRETLREAIRTFGDAAVTEQDSAASVTAAERALRLALDAAIPLAVAYSEQAVAIRRRASGKLNTLLGADLGTTLLDDYVAGQYLQTFNAAMVPMGWREIETREGEFCWGIFDEQIAWCRANGITVCAGPLLEFDQQSVPDWAYLSAGNFESLFTCASEFIVATVTRYRGKVDMWISAGRVNTGEAFSLTEEERVKLTARAIELTRALDAQADVTICFDQPWAEYLGRQGDDFPPLHFADALLRAELGLTGLALEINVGYSPGGTLSRDPLEFSRQIDFWSLLGVPLYLIITVPSSPQPDPLARRPAGTLGEAWTPAAQQTWVNRHLPLFLAKPAVRGVFWNQLRDSEPHGFAHGGLFDLRRHPKPALRQLASIRQAHLR